ncbi:MAG: hypothetical protein U0324_15225 [Polyangiales bacterium]
MTSEHVPASLQRRVRERARERCEYCGIAQELQEASLVGAPSPMLASPSPFFAARFGTNTAHR